MRAGVRCRVTGRVAFVGLFENARLVAVSATPEHDTRARIAESRSQPRSLREVGDDEAALRLYERHVSDDLLLKRSRGSERVPLLPEHRVERDDPSVVADVFEVQGFEGGDVMRIQSLIPRSHLGQNLEPFVERRRIRDGRWVCGSR